MNEDISVMVAVAVFVALITLVVSFSILIGKSMQTDCIKSMAVQSYKPDEISKLCGEIK